jgi:hypothetical protein
LEVAGANAGYTVKMETAILAENFGTFLSLWGHFFAEKLILTQ